MSVLTNTPPPVNDPIAQPKRKGYEERPDPLEGHVTREWLDYLVSQGTAIAQSSSRVATKTLNTQTASIGATDVTNGLVATGLYHFTYYASIVRASGGPSSLTVTLDWMDGGNAKAFSGAAITSNVVTASQFGGGLINVDSASPVRYSTTYSSGAGPTMAYDLDVVLERLS